jgi:hypothetical protein
MAEFWFYLTEEENRELIDMIISDGGEFIPSTHYPKKEMEILTDFEMIKKYMLKYNQQFLIQNNKYSSSPIDMRYIKEDGNEYWVKNINKVNGKTVVIVIPSKDFWYVNIQNGGPAIEYVNPRFELIENCYELIFGSLSYSIKYWDTIHEKMTKPPLILVDSYKTYIKFIKKKTIVIKKTGWKTPIWVSKSFLEHAKLEKKSVILLENIIQDCLGNLKL